MIYIPTIMCGASGPITLFGSLALAVAEALAGLVMAELARHYGLPVFGTGGATDSKQVDAQAGAEYAASLLMAAMAGTNLIHDVGYLDSGLTGSLESIVLGAEQIRWVKQFVGGFEVSEQTLAKDVLAQVGPAANFLGHDHTLEHLRRVMWVPYVADRRDYDGWVAAGGQDYAARAREHAQDLLRSHQPHPVNDVVEDELRELCNMPG